MKRYIRSNSQKGYWYLCRHGVGPGCWPKDAKMLEYKEHPTNGWKCYVKLDRFLTTSELKEYDLKEEVPEDVEGSTKYLADMVNCNEDCDYIIKEDPGYGFSVADPQTGQVVYVADTAKEAREWAESQGYLVSVEGSQMGSHIVSCIECTDESANVEEDDFDRRWDEKFGEPCTEVFAPEELDEWMQEVMDFE